MCLLIGFLVGITLLAFIYESKIVKIKSTNVNFSQRQPFPDMKTDDLSNSQIKLVNILKSEYNKQPKSYDQNMLNYSQGTQEPWCADFVSWVYNQAGMPLSNPNSGSWRIPGTQTLKQYFKTLGNWQEYNTGYQPKLGDVVIYDKNASPFGQHTNIVLKNEDGTITTVGGNENREVRIQTFKISDHMGIDGYGELKP